MTSWPHILARNNRLSSFNVKWRHYIKTRFVLILAKICNSVLTEKLAHTEKVVTKCFTNAFAIINISMLFPLPSPGSLHNVFYLQRQNVNNLHSDHDNERSERITPGRLMKYCCWSKSAQQVNRGAALRAHATTMMHHDVTTSEHKCWKSAFPLGRSTKCLIFFLFHLEEGCPSTSDYFCGPPHCCYSHDINTLELHWINCYVSLRKLERKNDIQLLH